MRFLTLCSISLFAAVVLLGLVLFLPITIATLSTVLVVLWILRRDGVHGQTALAIGLFYLFIWIITAEIGFNTAVTDLNQLAFLLFGAVGVGYLTIERLVAAAIASVRSSARGSTLGRFGSALLGALTTFIFAYKVSRMVSVRTYTAIGLVPGIALNLALSTGDFGALGQLIAEISGFAVIGFILGGAFLLDSLESAVSGLRKYRGESDDSVDGPNTSPSANIQELSDEQFLNLVEGMIISVHERGRLIPTDVDGYALIYAESNEGDELIIAIRDRAIPHQASEFVAQLEQIGDSAVRELGGRPDNLSLVTDVDLNEQLGLYLASEGLDVLDAPWFDERFG